MTGDPGGSTAAKGCSQKEVQIVSTEGEATWWVCPLGAFLALAAASWVTLLKNIWPENAYRVSFYKNGPVLRIVL